MSPDLRMLRLPRLCSSSTSKGGSLEIATERLKIGSVPIFSEFVSALDMIEAGLLEKRITFLRYDGTVTPSERLETKESSQRSEKPIILLITGRSGGEGLTLMRSRSVFMLTLRWNPATEMQCISRANKKDRPARSRCMGFYPANQSKLEFRPYKGRSSIKPLPSLSMTTWLMRSLQKPEATT